MPLHPESSAGLLGSPLIGSPSHRSDGGDTTADSINFAHLEGQHHWSTAMQNGSVEVPDTVPKREYYASLRRYGPGSGTGTLGTRLGSISGGSMLTVGGAGVPNTSVATVGSPYPSATMGRSAVGRSNTSALNFKPSGKVVDCAVIMLDGMQQVFCIDKAAYGQQLFDAVCTYLDLFEVDFFGIKCFSPDNSMCWLKLDQRIDKQIKKNWLFEFQVKFFPYDMDSITEDLTRYYLCLQVRQNLLSGQLPCSFFSYVILGAYVVQSDAGDFDPEQHHGIEYLRDHPFAPQHLQSPEMLHRIAATHRLLQGQTPELADRNFLTNAKKLALYGVHMHKVTSSSDAEHGLGVYYGGLLLYLGRIRLQRFSWPRIIKLSYRKRKFIVIVRALDETQGERTYEFRCPTELAAKRLWTLCVEHHNFFRLRGYERARKPSVLPEFSGRKYTYGQQQQHSTLGGLAGEQSLDVSVPHRPQPAVRRLQPQRRQISTPDEAWFTLPHNADNRYPNGTDVSQYQYTPQTYGAGDALHAPYTADWTNYGAGNMADPNRVRVGWATNGASLNLGEDDLGLVFGTEDGSTRGVITFNGDQFDLGAEVRKGDVIGCYLDFDHGVAIWSCNGVEGSQPVRIPERLLNESFFPAIGLKDSRVLVNFGDSQLEFAPKSHPSVPLADVADDQLVSNANSGWRLNPYDATAGIDVRPDGMAVQSALGAGWQGCRANRGVLGEGRFYYEARVVEPRGLARFGWATEDGQLILGTDRFGFAYGADHEGFGLNGQQGKRIHNNEINNYGESFAEDDIIGCFLDLTQQTVKWAKNGHSFGDAYRLPADVCAAFTSGGTPVALFPAVSLIDSTVELNFGDSQFRYFPGPDWTPLSYVTPEHVQLSSLSGPKHKARGWSYLDPHASNGNSKEQSDIPSEHDIALERAIQMTTHLDPDLFVVTSRVGSDHSHHHTPSSNARRTSNSSGNTRKPAAYISS
nr:unnamed protein product [Spirometra erinaceieuropaei]